MAASEPTVPGSNDLDSFFSETSEYEEPTETTADGEVKARRKRSSLMNIHKNIKDVCIFFPKIGLSATTSTNIHAALIVASDNAIFGLYGCQASSPSKMGFMDAKLLPHQP